jgi:hypothetical protein
MSVAYGYPSTLVGAGSINASLQSFLSIILRDFVGFFRGSSYARELRHLLAQFCDLPLCLDQLASIQDYESFSLLPGSPHFFKLSLHNIGLSKENVGSEATDEQDSRSKKNHSPSFEAKLRPLLLSVLYVALLTGLYFLGVKGICLLCTRNDKLGICYGITCTISALAGAIRIFMEVIPFRQHPAHWP